MKTGAVERMKYFGSSLKGLSPIFATLILIAITVVAGTVVYVFTSRTVATETSGIAAGQENVKVHTVKYTAGGNLTVYAQNLGSETANINGAIVKDASGNTIIKQGTLATNPTALAATGALGSIVVTNAKVPISGVYTVMLTSSAGGNFLSPQFIVTKP